MISVSGEGEATSTYVGGGQAMTSGKFISRILMLLHNSFAALLVRTEDSHLNLLLNLIPEKRRRRRRGEGRAQPYILHLRVHAARRMSRRYLRAQTLGS